MSNLNIDRISITLSGKERAKMMAFDLEEKLKTGKDTLTKAERDNLLDFNRTKDYYEYSFYWNLRELGMNLIKSNIEIALYKFNFLFLMIIVQDEHLPIFGDVKIDELYKGMQINLNSAYSYKELAEKATEVFDFPVLGGYYEKEVNDMLGTINLLKNIVNNALLFVKENDSENKECKNIKALNNPIIDSQLVDEIIDVLKRKMPKNVV